MVVPAKVIEGWRERAAKIRANRERAVRFSASPVRAPGRPSQAEQETIDHRIDGLLISWHEWRSGYSFSRGYSGSDSTCRDFRAPTHWDWKNGAAQERAESEIMRGVDRAIERVPNAPDRWRTAIEIEAKNLACGARVWSSAALPSNPDELHVVRIEARNRLVHELRREGVLT